MGKFTNAEIGKIKAICEQEIPALLKAGCDDDAYSAKRVELNTHIIQAAVGGEVGKNGKFKFNHELPSKTELATIAAELEHLVKNYEEPNLIDEGDDDDSIPAFIGAGNIPHIEKARNKSLRAAIEGSGCLPMAQLRITPVDVFALAGMGEEARKAHNTLVACIIAGVVVTVAVGVGVGVYYHNKKKDQEWLDQINDDLSELPEQRVMETDDDDAAEQVVID